MSVRLDTIVFFIPFFFSINFFIVGKCSGGGDGRGKLRIKVSVSSNFVRAPASCLSISSILSGQQRLNFDDA